MKTEEPEIVTRAKSQKSRYTPKKPARKASKVAVAKEEPSHASDNVISEELLSKINRAQLGDGSRKSGRNDKKAAVPTEVVFGQTKQEQARSFPKKPKQDLRSESASDYNEVLPKMGKQYVEPWDYEHSYYPVTLPMRRPHSGDPEILDEEEFGKASTSVQDETKMNVAEELGLKKDGKEPRLIFFQFPVNLPFKKVDDAVAGKGKAKKVPQPMKSGKLEDLPAGFMGKLLLYKSGKAKMKIGDTLYDVSAGTKCTFAQDVVAVNTKERHICNLGELAARAVVTPDVDSILDTLSED